MCNKKGFTLFQLILLILVATIIIVFVIFPILGHITSSKQRSFLSSAKFYIEETRSLLTLNKGFPVDQGESLTLQISELSLDQDKEKSVFGYSWVDEKSYIVVKNVGTMENPKYSYSIALEDVEGNCIDLEEDNKLLKENVKKGTCNIQPVGTIASSKIRDLAGTNTSDLKVDDYQNVRYYGKNPNNYVSFNNELWRILGVFSVDKLDRIKLIRNDSIGQYSFDTSSVDSNEGQGINDWSESKLLQLLNPGYEMKPVGGSLYWNRQKGTCYNGPLEAAVECDFSSIGLTKEAKALIEKSPFYLGKVNPEVVSAKERYEKEGNIYENSTSVWCGYVGLMQSSDYAYAMGREECIQDLRKSLDSCQSYNYLWLGQVDRKNEWMLTPNLSDTRSVFQRAIEENGIVNELAVAAQPNEVRPVVYLNPNVRIMSGNGTEESPYQLDIIN